MELTLFSSFSFLFFFIFSKRGLHERGNEMSDKITETKASIFYIKTPLCVIKSIHVKSEKTCYHHNNDKNRFLHQLFNTFYSLNNLFFQPPYPRNMFNVYGGEGGGERWVGFGKKEKI